MNFKSIKDKSKALYGKAKDKGKKAVHDKKKDIAIRVIEETKNERDNTSKERKNLSIAADVVADKFKGGGKIESLKSELEKAQRQLKNVDEEQKSHVQKKIDRLEKELADFKEEAPAAAKEKTKSVKYKFRVGQVLFKNTPDEIKIVKRRIEEGRPYYIINSADFGEDDASEGRLLQTIESIKKSPTKIKKPAEPKSEPAPEKSHSDKCTIKEKDGATLVSWNDNPDWIVSIEKKGDKWHSSCCKDDIKHPVQDSKEKAIKAAEAFLYCKSVMLKYKDEAKKTHEQRKKYAAKHGETNVSMTVKKTVETVENKVEKIVESGKAITKPQISELDKAIRHIIASIKVAIKGKDDKKKFVEHLISELKKML